MSELFLFEFDPPHPHSVFIGPAEVDHIKYSSRESLGEVTGIEAVRELIAIDGAISAQISAQIISVVSYGGVSKDQIKDRIRRAIYAVKHVLQGTFTRQSGPSATSCDGCARFVGIMKYCGECGRQLDRFDSEADQIEMLRCYIAKVGAKLNRRTCDWQQREHLYSIFGYPDNYPHKPTREQELNAALHRPVSKRIRDAIYAMAPDSDYTPAYPAPSTGEDYYLDLPANDEQLKKLQDQLTEPIFIFGARAEVLFTASHLEALLPPLARYKKEYGPWYHPELAIKPEYPNIYCLFRILCIHWSRINA